MFKQCSLFLNDGFVEEHNQTKFLLHEKCCRISYQNSGFVTIENIKDICLHCFYLSTRRNLRFWQNCSLEMRDFALNHGAYERLNNFTLLSIGWAKLSVQLRYPILCTCKWIVYESKYFSMRSRLFGRVTVESALG